MEKFDQNERAPSNAAGELRINRLLDLAFFPGRAPRSSEYRAGCAAALEFRILGTPIQHPHAPGTSAADAWAAGIEEGHSIWRAKSAPAGEQLAAHELGLIQSYRSMDARSQKMLAKFAVTQARECPRRVAPALRLVRGIVMESSNNERSNV
jgi:hypothetical protein